jgi:hypothetical protein
VPFALAFATIAVERRHADEGCDGFVADLPQFREFGDKRCSKYGPDARHGAQELVIPAPLWAGLDRLLELIIQACDLCVQGTNDLPDGSNTGRRRSLQAVALCLTHIDELLATDDESLEFTLFVIRQTAWLGLDLGSEDGQQSSIDLVGLGESSGGFGEVSDLARVDDGDGDAPGHEAGGDPSFISSGGFDDDDLGIAGGDVAGESSVVFWGVLVGVNCVLVV